MTPKFEAKIRASINKLRRQWPPIIAVKKRAKIGPELYVCEGCGTKVYSGKRSIDYIQIHHPDAIVGKIEADHISPVMPLDGRQLNLIEYVDAVFCPIENLMALCKDVCHLQKSLIENEERRENRKKLK